MKAISAGLKTEFAGEYTHPATCWKCTFIDGSIKTFTNHDQDFIFSTRTYLAASGYNATDIETKDALNVDNLEVMGMLSSPAITADDLRAGIWDFASVEIFLVNWSDATQGRLIQRIGNIGEVTTNRNNFQAEIRGLLQAYTRSVGKLTSPSCRAMLFDADCKVDPTTWTHTGAITDVTDPLTLVDTARTEAGPTGGVAITNVSNANPGVVTMIDDSLGLVEGQAVMISGLVSPANLNVLTIAHNPTGPTFELSADTSDTAAYVPYGGGGLVTPLGASSGYFDDGLMTFTSGLNDGFTREIKSYVPGVFTFYIGFPYPVSVGDTYTAKAGCNKEFFTGCKAKFANVVNFRGEKDIQGIDKLMQVGRQG